MKNGLIINLVFIFFTVFLVGCRCFLADDPCNSDAVIRFDYLSKADSANLIKNGQFEITDVRWKFLLEDPAGRQPDTLFYNDKGIFVYLWVITNPNLKGIVTQLSTFKADTIMVNIREISRPCCSDEAIIESLKLNGRNAPNDIIGATITLFK